MKDDFYTIGLVGLVFTERLSEAQQRAYRDRVKMGRYRDFFYDLPYLKDVVS